MVLTDSCRISRVPHYLGYFFNAKRISSTGLAPSMTGLSRPFDYTHRCCCWFSAQLKSPATPTMQRLKAITHGRFGLFRVRSPLLTESLLFSLPVGTEMFHFPTFPLSSLYIQLEITGSKSSWVSPFGNPRIKARLSAPRGLSQITTSFFGSYCQGIHRVLLKT